MSEGGQWKIYADGQCDFCRRMQRLAQRYDRDQRLDWRDFNLPAITAETPFSRDELALRLHVLTPDGRWHIGYFGWIAVGEALSRCRRLAAMARWWPFRWLGPKLYQFVANHRYRIPRFMLAWLGAPAPCPPAACPLPGQERGHGT
jgi:predicted DCC family thiol-disulfide oxidoreductase YuxK